MEMPAILPISPERAWQMVLGQLQLEMSRSAFETWVKSVEFVSLTGDQFIVGTYNNYGRDWLESRLTTTIQRLLQGILNQPVTVRFIVLDELQDGEDEVNRCEEDEQEDSEDLILQILHEIGSQRPDRTRAGG